MTVLGVSILLIVTHAVAVVVGALFVGVWLQRKLAAVKALAKRAGVDLD